MRIRGRGYPIAPPFGRPLPSSSLRGMILCDGRLEADDWNEVGMTDAHRCEPWVAREKTAGPGKTAWAAKTFRAVTAVLIFGVPLALGVSAMIGYGIHEARRRMAGRG